MKDGSKPFLLKNIYQKNYNIVITKNDFSYVNNYALFNNKDGYKVKYTLINNRLITSPESSLSIEKLSKDSLILSKNVKDIEAKDLEKYYYIRKDLALENELKKNLKKDTLIASPILGPELKASINKKFIKELSSSNKPLPEKERKKNYKFNGYVWINLSKKTADVELLNTDKDYMKEIQEKLQPLSKFNNWDISSLKNFKIIKVPFAFESYYKLSSEVESYGEIYNIFSTDYSLLQNHGPTFNQLQESNTSFAAAISEYQNKNYDKAIELFDKAYEINPLKLDAYYNSANISFFVGKKEKACKIWQYLMNEGQKIAEHEHNTKCQ